LLTAATALLFPADPCGFYSTAVPRSLASSSSSSHVFTVSSESVIVPNPSDPPKCPDNLPRVSSLFATSTERIHLATSFPPLAYGPPTAFLTLSTASASLCLAGLFHPTATSRIHLSGALPAAQPGRLVGGLCPLVVRLLSSHRKVALPIPTPGVPPPGLCSKQRSVANNRGFSPILCPIPS
jgi:hypothetical protein